MTSTDHFQDEKDYYLSEDEYKESVDRLKILSWGKYSIENIRNHKNKKYSAARLKYLFRKNPKRLDRGYTTNPRYRSFHQRHFTAGDINQFQEYRLRVNGVGVCTPVFTPKTNIFSNINLSSVVLWEKYQNLQTTAVINTFKYIYNKFKKGIFIKIQNNKLVVFLPFSNKNFVNEWGDKIHIDPNIKYSSKLPPNIPESTKKIIGFLSHVKTVDGYKYGKSEIFDYSKSKSRDIEYKDHMDPYKWYANNCILRYDKTEGDTNIAVMRDMFMSLCDGSRDLPDIEIFLNRRDFPLIKKDGTEAYEAIFGKNTSLVSHNYNQYLPILSMVTKDNYADIPIPTGDDWKRISDLEKQPKYFDTNKKIIHNFSTPWSQRKDIAIFRGGTTGCGITISTNMRLKLAHLSNNPKINTDEKGGKYFDAQLTKFNVRPRKLDQPTNNLQTFNIQELAKQGVTESKDYLTPTEQSKYKYIINVDGHVAAFRLSLELGMGSCLLIVDSPYKMWFRNILKPYDTSKNNPVGNTHYIPVDGDLGNLVDQIKWCRKNDQKAREIAENAKKFYMKYLQKEGILDYLQKLLINIKQETGIYLYNTKTPLQLQIENEENALITSPHPKLPSHNPNIINEHDIQPHSFLEGINWAINGNLKKIDNFFSQTKYVGPIFGKSPINFTRLNRKNFTGSTVGEYKWNNYSVAIKSSMDSQKMKENIHETFLGTKAINNLRKYIPNFMYIFGHFYTNMGDKKISHVIMEKIQGIPLKQYIEGFKKVKTTEGFKREYNKEKFNMTDYCFILIQLSLALHVAQNHCGLVHWDLAPWNIMINILDEAKDFYYIISYNKVVKITTRLVPVIIDYGKSHIISQNRHHGFINMYKTPPFQDIYNLIITSLAEVINRVMYRRKLDNHFYDKQNLNIIIALANFVSNTKFKNNGGKYPISDLQDFISRNRNYEYLTNNINIQTDNRTPLNLFYYMEENKLGNWDKKNIEINKSPPLVPPLAPPFISMNTGNTRQVFDFIYAQNKEEQYQSYLKVYKRILKCTLPIPENLFTVYYIKQQMLQNIKSVDDEFEKFMKKNGEPKKLIFKYRRIYMEAMDKIAFATYNKLIKKLPRKQISYSIPNFKKITYSQEDFSNPSTILGKLKDIPTNLGNLVFYKELIEETLLHSDKGKFTPEDREYYIKNFMHLLESDSFKSKSKIADVISLFYTAEQIYSLDKQNIIVKNELCEDVKTKYLDIYTKIENI